MVNRIISKLLSLALRGYRNVLSPLLPPACRFYPSCSAYAEEALARYGVRKGLLYSLRRIARCHPGSGGGYDPVN